MSCVLDYWLMARLGIENIQHLPQALRAAQEERLLDTLHHAKQKSSFYAKRLPDAPLQDIRRFTDVPFTVPQDLQEVEPFLCVSQAEVARMVTLQSSGTTALPKRVAFSQEDLASTVDFFTVGMSQLVSSGQRLLVLWAGAMRPYGVSALLANALAKNNIQVFSGEATTTHQSLLTELRKYDPHVLVAAPWQLHILQEILGSHKEERSLKAVLASAECLSEELEHALEAQGLVVLDHYGITEAGYGGGVQCLQKQGYHLRELDLWVEIVHPLTLQPLPHGQEGEIVITTLSRRAMPLIRYRTGDVACILAGPCPCGSPLTRLSKIRGRLVYTEQDDTGQGYAVKQLTKGIFYERSLNATL